MIVIEYGTLTVGGLLSCLDWAIFPPQESDLLSGIFLVLSAGDTIPGPFSLASLDQIFFRGEVLVLVERDNVVLTLSGEFPLLDLLEDGVSSGRGASSWSAGRASTLVSIPPSTPSAGVIMSGGLPLTLSEFFLEGGL